MKIYVKVSNFDLKVNFPIFQKNLVTYVTPSIYCSSFYCRIRFYEVVDKVFLNPLSKRFSKPCNVTYVMPFFERLKWNSVFVCSDDVHVWYQMKAYICANMKAKHSWKQNIQIYKNHVFADPMYIFTESDSSFLLKIKFLDHLFWSKKCKISFLFFLFFICFLFIVLSRKW